MCSKTNYEYYKKHHVCVRCRQEDAEKNHVLCFRCMIKNRESTQKYMNKNKEKIYKKNRISSRNRYNRLKEQGICTCCGKRKTIYNKVYCEICGAKRNSKLREKYLLNTYATRNMAEIRV